MNFARSSLKLFFAKSVGSIISFLGITYFARELGAAQVGIFFLFEAILGLLTIPADFGLNGAVEKRISEGESSGSFLSSAILLKPIPIAIIILIIIVMRPLLDQYIGGEVALLLALAIVLQEIARLSVFVLRGELRVGETAVLRMLRQVTWVGVGFVLVSEGFDAIGLIYGLLSGLFVMAVWGWYKCSTSLSYPSRVHAYSLIEYGKYNLISSVGGYVYNWMDVAVLGLFVPQSQVGAYEIAWRISSVVILFSTAIAETIFPQISAWDSSDAKSNIGTTISNAITPSLAFVIPSFFGVLVFSREILGIIFGSEFTIAWVVLIILMGEKLFQAVHKILGRGLQGVDRPDLAAYATISSIFVNLALNIILIIQLGITGAAVATMISFALNTVIHGHFVSKFVDIEIPYLELGWLVLSSASMAVILMTIQRFIVIDNTFRLATVIAIGAATYGIVALSNHTLRRKLLRQIRLL